MNLQQQEQFYQFMTRVKGNSKAASTKEEARITEMVNGLLVSKPANQKEPVVIDLQEYAKSASVQGINKLREIHNFIRSNGRI